MDGRLTPAGGAEVAEIPVQLQSALLVLLVTASLASWFLTLTAPLFARIITVSDIRPSTGKAFIGQLSDPKLSDHEQPSGAQLYLVEDLRGTHLHIVEKWCGSSYACAWLSALLDANFPGATYEKSRMIGPGGSLHQDIFDVGGGRYSVWHGQLYFSLPDDGSALRMKRLYLRQMSPLQHRLEITATLLNWLRNLCILALGVILVRGMWPKWFGWAASNLVPGFIVSVATLLLIAAAVEFYFRASQRFPVSEIRFPRVFLPGIGHTMEPNASTRWTNGTDFWVTDRANSLGFLDREPALPKPEATFRVMLIGDSFVEAAQVPLARKTQTLLAAALKEKFPTLESDVVALGFSGTGQSNQIAYYERNRKEFRPDVVILLFVRNDFANNSALLESLRHGFHPDHVPRLYFSASAGCERIPIDNNWQSHLLTGSSPQSRAAQLRATSPVYERALRGADIKSEGDLDWTFYRPTMPPVFEEAVISTGCAFAEWKRLAEEDHFKLFVVTAEGVRAGGEGQMTKLQNLLQPLGIPLLDLYPVFHAHADPATAHWRSDAHWSPTGHRWAAEAIFDYMIANGLIPKG